MFKRALIALFFLSTAQGAVAEPPLSFAELGECPLESGAVLQPCRLAYRDIRNDGQPDAPVLVFLTWYGGTSADLVQFGNIGPGALADTDRYRVIVIDALGNGVSSSPSNSPGQDGEDFPDLSIGDMVAAQHRLLTGTLGLARVHAVMGISMGGMQTFEWLVRHPEFASRFVSIEGTPWQAAYDLLLWQAWVDLFDAFDGSAGSLAFTQRLAGKFQALMLWTPDYLARTLPAEGVAEFLKTFTPQWTAGDIHDLRSQAQAMAALDVRRSGLPEVPPRALVVVSRSDHVVTPGPSLEFAKTINAQTLVLEGDCGHLATSDDCELERMRSAVHAFLAAP